MLSHINVGSGELITIAELSNLVSRVVDYACDIYFDTTKADGTLTKLMDSSRIEALGWRARTTLQDGLALVYEDFLRNYASEF